MLRSPLYFKYRGKVGVLIPSSEEGSVEEESEVVCTLEGKELHRKVVVKRWVSRMVFYERRKTHLMLADWWWNVSQVREIEAANSTNTLLTRKNVQFPSRLILILGYGVFAYKQRLKKCKRIWLAHPILSAAQPARCKPGKRDNKQLQKTTFYWLACQ